MRVKSRISDSPNSIFLFKGTVQRELRWVKIGINRTARINCIADKCHFPCPKGHHHESIINVLGGCSTFWRHPNRLGQYTQQRRTNSVTASEHRRCAGLKIVFLGIIQCSHAVTVTFWDSPTLYLCKSWFGGFSSFYFAHFLSIDIKYSVEEIYRTQHFGSMPPPPTSAS